MARKKRVSISKENAQPLPHKSFWIFMVALLFVSSIVILSSIGDSAITGQATFQPISFLKAGSTLEMEVKTIFGLKTANIQVLQDIKNGQITFREDTTIPFEGVFLSKFQVSSSDAGKFGTMELTLKVTQADLEAVGLRSGEVTLFVNGKTIPLIRVMAEKIAEQSGEYVFYNAALPFEEGEYVIGRGQAHVPEYKKGMALPITSPSGNAAKGEIIPVESGPETISAWSKIKNFFKSILSAFS